MGEVFTCGRKLNGEIFKFSSYHSMTEIFKNKKLVVKENLLIRPAITDVLSIGQLEGFTHQASLIYLDENYQQAEITQKLHEWLSAQEGIIFGITAAPINGSIVRILGTKAEQLHDCLKTITHMLKIQNIALKSIGTPSSSPQIHQNKLH
jgi:urease accessory protein